MTRIRQKRSSILKNINELESKRVKILISESQFKVLAKNVLNEQAKNTIKKTHLIKTKNDAKKK
jgi:hypothetical protein